MGDMSRKIDVEKLISYSDDLVEVLKDKRDLNSLTQCLDLSKSLQSSCEADFNSVLNSIQGIFEYPFAFSLLFLSFRFPK